MNIAKGSQYMLLSTVCFTLMQTLIKFMPQFGSFQHIFFRSIIGWGMCVGFLVPQGISLKGKNQKMLIFRGLIGSVSMFSFFYVLTHIPFGSAVAFKYLSPIFTAIFAVFMLQEKVTIKQWGCFAITFFGIILLKGFDVRIETFDLFIGLLSGVSGGLLYIVIRKIGEDDHPLVILHYFMLISTIFSGIVAFQSWKMPSGYEWLWLIAIGVVGFIAQNFFTKSIQETSSKVSSLAFLRYSEVVYALIIGFILFGETYNLQSFIGIGFIFTGLILAYLHNKK